jgi:hypothetical protein
MKLDIANAWAMVKMSTKPKAHVITFTYFYRFTGIFYFMSPHFGSYSLSTHAIVMLHVCCMFSVMTLEEGMVYFTSAATIRQLLKYMLRNV